MYDRKFESYKKGFGWDKKQDPRIQIVEHGEVIYEELIKFPVTFRRHQGDNTKENCLEFELDTFGRLLIKFGLSHQDQIIGFDKYQTDKQKELFVNEQRRQLRKEKERGEIINKTLRPEDNQFR